MKADNTSVNRITILGIESSCDDTAASVVVDGRVRSNVVANQRVHEAYGGVVPELASRAHLSHLIPTVNQALAEAGMSKEELSAIAVTQGPGLLGSLVVGVCAARGLAAGLGLPIVGIHHMVAHIMACFIEEDKPDFPFLCLTVSGGHTQLTYVRAIDEMEVIGQTRDDAAGEAFDKIGSMIGLKYPAGPFVDQLAANGEPRYQFTRASIDGLDFSFSGLKTQVMYFIRDEMEQDPRFVDENKAHIAASVQLAIVDMLMEKLEMATKSTGVQTIALAGGVSANRVLRSRTARFAENHDLDLHIPALPYCTDNAAMIAMAGYYKYKAGEKDDLSLRPYARL